MQVNVIEIKIDETNYPSNPHSSFHLYLRLFSHIDFHKPFSFPVPIYTYPLPTTASVHALTAEELLGCPILASYHKPSDDDLLETPIFNLNIAKLWANVLPLSPTSPSALVDLTVLGTSINKFLKHMQHHWQDYPPALHTQITEILMLAPATTTAVPQQMPLGQMALIVAQSAPQPTVAHPPLTVQMDVQQQPSTSTA
uniref:Uncharacterized protein n=1 Tax=Romanomermis culicivorax TaxID=13658 RepID=A0A915IKL9_ROMCU